MALVSVYTDAFAAGFNAGWTNPPPLSFSLGNERPWVWQSASLIAGTPQFFSLMTRNTGTYANDGYIISDVQADSSGAAVTGVIFRMNPATGIGYAFVMSNIAGDPGKYGLFCFDSGGWRPWHVSAGSPGSWPASRVMAQFQGSNLRMYTDEGAGFVQRVSTTEASYGSGKPGLIYYDNTLGFNAGATAFDAGDITADVLPDELYRPPPDRNSINHARM